MGTANANATRQRLAHIVLTLFGVARHFVCTSIDSTCFECITPLLSLADETRPPNRLNETLLDANQTPGSDYTCAESSDSRKAMPPNDPSANILDSEEPCRPNLTARFCSPSSQATLKQPLLGSATQPSCAQNAGSNRPHDLPERTSAYFNPIFLPGSEPVYQGPFGRRLQVIENSGRIHEALTVSNHIL